MHEVPITAGAGDSPEDSRASLAAVYVAGFQARVAAVRAPGERVLSDPGLAGTVGVGHGGATRLLISSDSAAAAVSGLVGQTGMGAIAAFATAPRCLELVRAHGPWSETTETAMAHRDLTALPALPLPAELTLVPVARTPADDVGGLGGTPPGEGGAPGGRGAGGAREVPLAMAVRAALAAAPEFGLTLASFTASLAALGPAYRLFAALDSDGTVRATAGVGCFGAHAVVIFINTDRDWRRRGIAAAMTVAALQVARRAGARDAYLDATKLGRGVYERIGFEVIGPVVRFRRPAS